MKIIKGGVTSPKGFKANGFWAGIKKSAKPDLGLLYSQALCHSAAVFTRNSVKAAPNVVRTFTVFTNPPPAVTLASPVHRQSFKLGAAVALSASAVDPQAEAVTNLTVFANNAPVGSANGGTFTDSWTYRPCQRPRRRS